MQKTPFAFPLKPMTTDRLDSSQGFLTANVGLTSRHRTISRNPTEILIILKEINAILVVILIIPTEIMVILTETEQFVFCF